MYQPGIEIVSDEETLPDLSGYDRFYVLDKKERLIGTIVPDDTRELAIDLATVDGHLKWPTRAIRTATASSITRSILQNRSSDNDPLIAPYVAQPQDVPAMIGFDARASLDRADERRGRGDGRRAGHRRRPRHCPPTERVNANNQPLPPPGATLAPPKVIPQM